MLTIVGNGPSRKKYKLNELGEWWGCNLIFEEEPPHLLFAIDIEAQCEIINNNYYRNHKVYVGEWNPLEIGHLEGVYFGYSLSNYNGGLVKHLHEDDTDFVVQGNGESADFLGYNNKYSENLLTTNDTELRNLFSGMSALGYAMQNGYEEVVLLGFDALQFGDPSNVYEGSGRLGYLNKYTEESRVFDAQRSQFIALLKNYPNTKVYFKNSVDELELIEYTELPYYETSPEWILGIGFQ